MKRIKRKLRSAGGLTMVEVLCATAIMILLCLMMNAGIQIAASSFRKETAESETQLLLNTLTDALSDKLRYAVVTKEADGTLVSSIDNIHVTDGKVMVGSEELLPAGVYHGGKYAAAPLEADGKIVTIDDTGCYFTVKLKVKEASGGENTISAETTLTLRCLNPPPPDAPAPPP